jgi:hypothetical protein
LRSWNSSSNPASSLEPAAIPDFTSLEQALAQTVAFLRPSHPGGLVAFARRFLSLLVKEPLAANLLGQAR